MHRSRSFGSFSYEQLGACAFCLDRSICPSKIVQAVDYDADFNANHNSRMCRRTTCHQASICVTWRSAVACKSAGCGTLCIDRVTFLHRGWPVAECQDPEEGCNYSMIAYFVNGFGKKLSACLCDPDFAIAAGTCAVEYHAQPQM
jgi:hypothetical protein